MRDCLYWRIFIQALAIRTPSSKNHSSKVECWGRFYWLYFFAHHILLRTRTKKRMHSRLKATHGHLLNNKIEWTAMDQQLQSYLGILSHANQFTLSLALKNAYWVRQGM
jgi:hypothetical protein